jgi:hypothetical protein
LLIHTTGARLVEDVALLADCPICLDTGEIEGVMPWDAYRTCICRV